MVCGDLGSAGPGVIQTDNCRWWGIRPASAEPEGRGRLEGWWDPVGAEPQGVPGRVGGCRPGEPEAGGGCGEGDPGKGALFRNGSRAERRGGRFSMGEIATPQPKPGAAAEALLLWPTDHLGNAQEPPSVGREQGAESPQPAARDSQTHDP